MSTTYTIKDSNNHDVNLSTAIENLFDSSNNCAFYAEDEDALNFNKPVPQNVETNSTIILQHTLFVIFVAAIALNMTDFLYKYLYYIPSLKHYNNPSQPNITPITVLWAIITIAITGMIVTAGISKNPIYLVWGFGYFITFIIVLFKITITQKNYTMGSFNLGDFFRLISTNKISISGVSIFIQIAVWLAIIAVGTLSIMNVFTRLSSTISHILFLLCVVLTLTIPMFFIYNYSSY